MTLTRSTAISATLGVALLTAASAYGPARAADEAGSFAIHGVGAVPCGQLTAGLLGGEAALRETLGSWLTGYLSATNRLKTGVYDATPVQQPAALTTMVVNLCLSNPDALVETAVNSLVEVLAPGALASESPQVEVTAGDRSVRLRDATLKQVQAALIERGLLAGAADGVFGPSTERALREFQKTAGLSETGLPDANSVVRLLANIPDSAPAQQE